MRPVGVLGALCLVLAGAVPARAGSFYDTIRSQPLLRPLAAAMRDSVARTIPVVAASPGVTFHFDPETGAFEREMTVAGQVFLERAEPLGRHRWNTGINYEWIHLDTLDGGDLDHLSDTNGYLVDPGGAGFVTIPHARIALVVQQVTLTGTYGLTDDLDVNVTLPLLASSFGLDGLARRPTGFVGSQTAHERQAAFGVGDLQLRAKYRAVHGTFGDVALGLGLRVPTGAEDDFQGIGVWEVSPALYGSTPRVAVGGPVTLQLHANAIFDLNANDVSSSQGRFGVGLDCGIGERVTGAIAFLAREPFAALASPGAFDVQRVRPRTGASFEAPLFGLDTGRQSYWDLSVGGRVVLWRDTLFAYAHVLLPLNDDGFRADAIPVAGVEATF